MGKDKRDNIIEGARELFAQYGFSKTTIEDIAEKSRTAKSTIYFIFRSKEEIIEAVIDKEGRILSEEIMTAIGKSNDAEEMIYIYIFTRMRHIKKLVNYYSIIRDDYIERPAFIENARRKSIEWEISTINTILQSGVQNGVFAIKNTKMTAYAIVASLKGLDFSNDRDLDIPDTDESINNFIEILFNGINKR